MPPTKRNSENSRRPPPSRVRKRTKKSKARRKVMQMKFAKPSVVADQQTETIQRSFCEDDQQIPSTSQFVQINSNQSVAYSEHNISIDEDESIDVDESNDCNENESSSDDEDYSSTSDEDLSSDDENADETMRDNESEHNFETKGDLQNEGGPEERTSGNAIVELKYMTDTLLKAQHAHKNKCPGVLFLYDNATAAFRNKLTLKCKQCEEILKFDSVSPEKSDDIAKSFYMGTASAGLTYETSRQLLSVMDVKVCSYNTFAEKATLVEPALEEVSSEVMDDAIKLEMAIAVEKNNIDEDGYYCITAAIDGAWNKRSYGHGHSASSGAAVIVGIETGQVLWIGVKNRRCKACDYKNLNHKCYCNWDDAPGGMEGALLLEAFIYIYEKYRIKITKVVADGDSSVFNKIKEGVCYSSQIEKLLCMNHNKKNYKKSMYKLNKESKYSPASRKILIKYRNKFVHRLQYVVKHCADTGAVNVAGLKSDILEIMNHSGGCHLNCRPDVCPEAGNNNEDPEYSLLKKTPLFNKLMELLTDMSAKAYRLRYNVNTNIAEGLFSGLNKVNCGKRVDLAARGEFQRRVLICASNYNNSSWILNWVRKATGHEPGLHLTAYERSHTKRRNYDKARQRPPKKKKQVTDDGYGEDADTSLVELVTDQEIKDKLDEYKKNDEEKNVSLLQTSSQHKEQIMEGRIECHHISNIIKSRKEDVLKKKIPSILSKAANSEYLQRNAEFVTIMRDAVNEKNNTQFENVGALLHPEMPYICCCPDGRSADGKSILFVEPVKTKMSTILEAAQHEKEFALSFKNNSFTLVDLDLKRKVQAAINICQSETCTILFYRTASDFQCVTIQKENQFWIKNKSKIENFFNEFIKFVITKNMKIN